MNAVTFESQRDAWERIPVDDVGYISARTLAGLADYDLRETVRKMEAVRYHGPRNHDNLWCTGMGHSLLFGRVLDYGCGIGIEALQYARSGNTVSVADINSSSVRLAARVLRLHGFNPARCMRIGKLPPYTEAPSGEYHMVAMNGVLHHVPNPQPVVAEASRLLRDGGELRLMVYSDQGWRIATGTEPPDDVAMHPAFQQFVRFFDSVGGWADWYSYQRLQERFGKWFDVREARYIMPDSRYMTAVLVKR